MAPRAEAGAGLPIYLDNHATTRVDPRVVDAMRPYFEDDFGNAASKSHVFGWRAEAAVEQARESLAASLGAMAREIVFTSGATEANNLALLGVARAAGSGHIVTNVIEHPSVLDAVEQLGREGFDTTVLPVDGAGRVDPEAVGAALRDDTLVVSVSAANGEIGTLQPLAEIGALCRARGVVFHVDAAQAVTKLPFDVEAAAADLVSVCAHKLHGPKGVGLLFVRRRRPRIRLQPMFFGGGHERGLRSGTLPVALCVGFARAVALGVDALDVEPARLAVLRDRLKDALEKGIDGVRVNGPLDARLPGNLNLAFEGVLADSLLIALHDVALSTGSACSSADPRPSPVLTALGLPEEQVRESVRFGLGRFNTEDEIDRAAARIVEEVKRAREQRPGAGRVRRD
ncbi:MAG: cysteine desulfurase [Deltaproteobacteria bacterium]|nr:cysteine desulfurase [Deltaproteobacteria bacterium]MBW2446635.1 cysteine desulfurase [Deltaproteobacteria bacterium]